MINFRLPRTIWICIAVFLTGCASSSYYYFQNVPTENQTQFEKGAGRSTTTEDDVSAVSVGFKNVSRKGNVHPYFQVCAFNKSTIPATLDRNQIVVITSDKTYRTWSYSETLSIIQSGFRSKRQSIAFAEALAMFANIAASQSYSSTSTYGTINTYASNGSSATAYVQGNSYTTGIDSTALAIRNAETQKVSAAAKARMSRDEQVAIEQIEDYLGVVKVSPGKMQCGKISLPNELYSYDRFTIHIKFNGHDYSYQFTNRKIS